MYSFSVSQSLYAKRCWSVMAFDVGVGRRLDRGLEKARFMSLGVYGEGAEELLRLVKGFSDGESPFDPVDCGVDFFAKEVLGLCFHFLD